MGIADGGMRVEGQDEADTLRLHLFRRHLYDIALHSIA